MLNELLRDERADVRVVGEHVERRRQLVLRAGRVGRAARAGAAREHRAVKILRAGVVSRPAARHHRVAVVRDAVLEGDVEPPAGEDACEVVDGRLRVGGDGVALRVEHGRAVEVQLVRADREELVDLAGEVLVRALRRALVHVEVVAHRGGERDVAEERAVAAEGVAVERLKIRRHPRGAVDGEVRDDENLVEREGHALAQLRLARQRVREELLLQRVDRVVVAQARRLVGGACRALLRRVVERESQVGPVRAFRGVGDGRVELLVEEGADADLLYVLHVRAVALRPPRRLL